MARYAAFLRGVNLGGHRRVSNERLRAVFEKVGNERVTTFRASGNVIFDPKAETSPDAIRSALERGLADSLGFGVTVFLRSARQVRAIAAHRPFGVGAHGKAQVALLPGRPGRRAREEALAMATAADRLAVRGSELYWLPSGRTSESGLDLRALEALVGPWTVRTLGTIEQIAERHC